MRAKTSEKAMQAVTPKGPGIRVFEALGPNPGVVRIHESFRAADGKTFIELIDNFESFYFKSIGEQTPWKVAPS